MICRSCERELPEREFYWKPGGRLMNPDCRQCFKDVQKVRVRTDRKILSYGYKENLELQALLCRPWRTA